MSLPDGDIFVSRNMFKSVCFYILRHRFGSFIFISDPHTRAGSMLNSFFGLSGTNADVKVDSVCILTCD